MPTEIKEEYLTYLTELEHDGIKEVLPYLQSQFPDLSLEEARQVLKFWTATKFQTLSECSPS